MAARPIWKGAIGFGLVHVPVALYGLEKKADLSFKLLDSRNHSTIRYERINEVTGEEVPWDKIVKGYEYSQNNYVVLEEEDFKKVAVEATQTIDITDFVEKSEISDLYIDKPYVLVPQKKAEKGYVLLREALAKTGMAGIAKVVIRTREYLSAVVAQDDALVLLLLRFSQELKPLSDFELPSEDLKHYKITQKELDLAVNLIEAQKAKWNPEQYQDDFREELLKWIEKKVKSDGVIVAATEDEPEPKSGGASVEDLAELLRKSVEEFGRKGKGSAKK
ncbi:MAG: Ku protein [Fimbriimonadaceae bacterium]